MRKMMFSVTCSLLLLCASTSFAQISDSIHSPSPPGESVKDTFASSIEVSAPYTDSLQLVRDVAEYTSILRRLDSLEASKPLLVPYSAEILEMARKHKVPAALLAALIQNESKWDPWATRSENHYKTNKVVQREARAHSKKWNGIPTYQTELDDRAQSMGLMQPMLQVAREQGFKERFGSALYLPRHSIEQGAIHLAKKFKRYGKDTLAVISSYNQGTAFRRGGTFTNAEYVYGVSVAYKVYQKIFARNERQSSSSTLTFGAVTGQGGAHAYKHAQLKGRSAHSVDRDRAYPGRSTFGAHPEVRSVTVYVDAEPRHADRDRGRGQDAAPIARGEGEPPPGRYNGIAQTREGSRGTFTKDTRTAWSSVSPFVLGVALSVGIVGFVCAVYFASGGHANGYDKRNLRSQRGQVFAERGPSGSY